MPARPTAHRLTGPPESRRYLVEAVLTWARHYVDTGSDAGLASVAAAPLKKPHIVRHIISTQIRSEWPRKQLLGAKPEHAEQLLRILHYVSKRTSAPAPLRPPARRPPVV